MRIQSIFTPNDIPTVTYVDRAEHKLEQRLRDHFETPNVVISVSGPSKSGKTVLIKKVIPSDQLITIPGAGITSGEDLWDRVLFWMNVPAEVQTKEMSSNALTGGAEVGGKVKVPLVAEGEGKTMLSGSRTWGGEESKTFRAGGLQQVVREIAGSEFAVFIDDFHYIPTAIQSEIGRQIKVAAENGVKIITASVPHRADDVVRSNPELRGRVAAVDLTYWTLDELSMIARRGFDALNLELSPAHEKQFAEEAFGSPQLMQTICLNVCYVKGVRETQAAQARLPLDSMEIEDVLARTSTYTDFTKMLLALHTGPRTRGTERKIHELVDGTRGDVYRAILLALCQNPAELAFPYDKILDRVRSVCMSDPPVGSSITSALEQMHDIAEETQPGTSPLGWDNTTLDVVDPYFIFFLRCSGRLASLV